MPDSRDRRHKDHPFKCPVTKSPTMTRHRDFFKTRNNYHCRYIRSDNCQLITCANAAAKTATRIWHRKVVENTPNVLWKMSRTLPVHSCLYHFLDGRHASAAGLRFATRRAATRAAATRMPSRASRGRTPALAWGSRWRHPPWRHSTRTSRLGRWRDATASAWWCDATHLERK